MDFRIASFKIADDNKQYSRACDKTIKLKIRFGVTGTGQFRLWPESRRRDQSNSSRFALSLAGQFEKLRFLVDFGLLYPHPRGAGGRMRM